MLASDTQAMAVPFWLLAKSPKWAGIAVVDFDLLLSWDAVFSRRDMESQLFDSQKLRKQAVDQPIRCQSDADFSHTAFRLEKQTHQALKGRELVLYRQADRTGLHW